MDKLKAVSNCSDSLTKAPTADNNLSILNTKVNVKNAYAAFKIRQNEDILESRIQLKHASSNIFSDSDKGNLCQKTFERSYTLKLHYNGIGEDELWHVNTTAWCVVWSRTDDSTSWRTCVPSPLCLGASSLCAPSPLSLGSSARGAARSHARGSRGNDTAPRHCTQTAWPMSNTVALWFQFMPAETLHQKVSVLVLDNPQIATIKVEVYPSYPTNHHNTR